MSDQVRIEHLDGPEFELKAVEARYFQNANRWSNRPYVLVRLSDQQERLLRKAGFSVFDGYGDRDLFGKSTRLRVSGTTTMTVSPDKTYDVKLKGMKWTYDDGVKVRTGIKAFLVSINEHKES